MSDRAAGDVQPEREEATLSQVPRVLCVDCLIVRLSLLLRLRLRLGLTPSLLLLRAQQVAYQTLQAAKSRVRRLPEELVLLTDAAAQRLRHRGSVAADERRGNRRASQR